VPALADHEEHTWLCASGHDYAEAITHYFRHDNMLTVRQNYLVCAECDHRQRTTSHVDRAVPAWRTGACLHRKRRRIPCRPPSGWIINRRYCGRPVAGISMVCIDGWWTIMGYEKSVITAVAACASGNWQPPLGNAQRWHG
jgi:hypothetical protein